MSESDWCFVKNRCEKHNAKLQCRGVVLNVYDWYCYECDKEAEDTTIMTNTKKFEREERYIVFKISDIEKYSTKNMTTNLHMIANEIALERIMDEKQPINCVVVEHDWPMFNSTWDAIKKWVTNND